MQIGGGHRDGKDSPIVSAGRKRYGTLSTLGDEEMEVRIDWEDRLFICTKLMRINENYIYLVNLS